MFVDGAIMNHVDPQIPLAGYSSWVDIAVDAFDPSDPNLSGRLIGIDAADLPSIRELARAEVVELRAAKDRRDIAQICAPKLSVWHRLAKSLAREARRAATEVPRDYFAPLVGAIRGIWREYRAIDRIRAAEER